MCEFAIFKLIVSFTFWLIKITRSVFYSQELLVRLVSGKPFRSISLAFPGVLLLYPGPGASSARRHRVISLRSPYRGSEWDDEPATPALEWDNETLLHMLRGGIMRLCYTLSGVG